MKRTTTTTRRRNCREAPAASMPSGHDQIDRNLRNKCGPGWLMAPSRTTGRYRHREDICATIQSVLLSVRRTLPHLRGHVRLRKSCVRHLATQKRPGNGIAPGSSHGHEGKPHDGQIETLLKDQGGGGGPNTVSPRPRGRTNIKPITRLPCCGAAQTRYRD